MDQTIRLAVLYGSPNSYSDRLSMVPRDSAPWQVRRKEEWIDANWRESITIEKLVEISNAGARRIFATFRSALGEPSSEALRRSRPNAS
jgi:hypothetical protein